MPVLIPVINHGNREISVDTLGGGVYRFRTYYSRGRYSGWFVDIADTAGEAILLGVRVVPGCPNLLKGQGNAFRGVQLAAVVLNGTETEPEYLGDGVYLYWLNPGEENPFRLGDPMIDIPKDWYAFHQEASKELFGTDGHGRIFVEGMIMAASTDPLAVLDADAGRVRLKASADSGTVNEYMAIDSQGRMALKE